MKYIRLITVVLTSLTLLFSISTSQADQADASSGGLPAGITDSDWKQILAVQPRVMATTAFPDGQVAYLKGDRLWQRHYFGRSVAISSDTVVVGTPHHDNCVTSIEAGKDCTLISESGGVYVFTRNSGIWSQQAYLVASNLDEYDYFGWSVDISGDTLVVGAYREDSNATGVGGNQSDNSMDVAGAAYVFTRSGSTWTQTAYLKSSSTEANGIFGWSVAVDGDTVVVGAHGEDLGSGAVHVFTRSGGIWSPQATLKGIFSGVCDSFGWSVAVSGETAAVGAIGETNSGAGRAGAVYIFTRSGSAWSQQAYLQHSSPSSEDWFGNSLDISGDTIVVGMYKEDSNATGVNGNPDNDSAADSGAALVFTRTGSTWTQEAYLKASNTGAGDHFGSEVSIRGDIVVVGAPMEDSSARGVNGDQTNNSSSNAGAAYVFLRTGTTWNQVSYLKASNTGANDNFGVSVENDGNTAVLGASGEDSSSLGVNWDGDNNLITSSGAAYIFLDTVTDSFKSTASYDGGIVESSEDSGVGGSVNSTLTTFKLGDSDVDRQYRAILHFDTSSLPDEAIVSKATLKIKRYNIVGDNPFVSLNNIVIAIRRGAFYSNPVLQRIDFRAFANLNFAGTIPNTPTIDGWYAGIFKYAALPFFNLTGSTQVRLRYYLDDDDDMSADYIRFYSGNHPYGTYQPILEVEYYIP